LVILYYISFNLEVMTSRYLGTDEGAKHRTNEGNVVDKGAKTEKASLRRGSGAGRDTGRARRGGVKLAG
jgi:hypothetical protein